MVKDYKNEYKRKYEKRQHAKSDKPLAKQVSEKCIECNSPDTLLIYDYKSTHSSDYGDDAGWVYEDRIREYKCKFCGIYFEIECSSGEREYYTR